MNAVVPTVPARVPARIPAAVWASLGLLLVFGLLALAIHHGLQGLHGLPVQVVIDGNDVSHRLDLADMPPAHRLVLALLVALLALVALVVVPLVLAIVVAVVLLVAAFGLGLPLLAVAIVLGVLLSPLIACGALLWWALRRRPPSTTIDA